MKRKVFSILTAMFAAVLITSTVFAGAIKLSGSARLGSIIFQGYVLGIGKTNWNLEMTATGVTSVICTNPGSNDVPGQSYPKVTGKAIQAIPEDQIQKNGKAPVFLKAKPAEEENPIPWDIGGCPNPNWTGKSDFVYWDGFTILVKDPLTDAVTATFKYTCTTVRIPQNDGYTFDDGKVTCTLIK